MPSIVAVIGHTESDATIAAAPVYGDRAHGGKDPVPVVTPAGRERRARACSPWIYRVNVTIGEQGRVLARYADSMGFKRAGVLYRNEPSGKDFVVGVHRRVREAWRRRHRARSVHRGHLGLRCVREAPREERCADRRRRRQHPAEPGDDPCAPRRRRPAARAEHATAPRRRTRATSAGCTTSCCTHRTRPVAVEGAAVRHAVPRAIRRESGSLGGARLRRRDADRPSGARRGAEAGGDPRLARDDR